MHYNLDIQCRIWSNNQNNLIDFESDEGSSINLRIASEGFLYLNNNELLLQAHLGVRFPKPPLCQIKRGKDMYEVELPVQQSVSEVDDITWMLLHNYQQTNEFGYRIREGDLFKCGKYILKVRQLHIKKDSMIKTLNENKTKVFKDEDEDVSHNVIFHKEVPINITKQPLNESDLKKINAQNNKLLLLNDIKANPNHNNKDKDKENNNINKSMPTCRICLSEDHDDLHPLINPCKCSGTMKFIHLDCLRSLIQSKITEKKNGCVSVFSFKNLECELCQALFPEKVRIKEMTYTIIDLQRPNGNYILLEGLIKETKDMKTIYVIAFNDEKRIRIGRSSDSDFRLADISVSRNHALLVIENGGYYLYDTKSKFGSLIKAYKTIGIFPHRHFVLNKSKVCLSFIMRLKFCSMLVCYKPKKHYLSANEYFEEQYYQEEKERDKGNSNCNNNDKSLPDFLRIDTQEVSLFDSQNGEELTIDVLTKKEC